MSWPNSLRCLPTLVALAVTATCSPALTGQPSLQSTPLPATSTEISGRSPEVFSPSQAIAGPAQSASAYQALGTPEEVGDSLMSHQRYQAAIAAYKKEPQLTSDMWNKVGIAYQLMFNSEEAAHCYQASLRLEPKNARVLNNLGTIYDSMKEYSSAERMYHRAIKLDPTRP